MKWSCPNCTYPTKVRHIAYSAPITYEELTARCSPARGLANEPIDEALYAAWIDVLASTLHFHGEVHAYCRVTCRACTLPPSRLGHSPSRRSVTTTVERWRGACGAPGAARSGRALRQLIREFFAIRVEAASIEKEDTVAPQNTGYPMPAPVKSAHSR